MGFMLGCRDLVGDLSSIVRNSFLYLVAAPLLAAASVWLREVLSSVLGFCWLPEPPWPALVCGAAGAVSRAFGSLPPLLLWEGLCCVDGWLQS